MSLSLFIFVILYVYIQILVTFGTVVYSFILQWVFLLHYRKLGLPVKGLKKELISTLKLHMDNSSQGMSLHTKNTHFISISCMECNKKECGLVCILVSKLL